MKFLAMRAVVAALMMVMVSSAADALVLRIDFEAALSISGGPATQTGSFLLSFDPTVDVEDAAVINGNVNFDIVGPVVFDFDVNRDAITIGAAGNASATSGSVRDFVLSLADVTTAPRFVDLAIVDGASARPLRGNPTGT
ncbi:MAG: hypothetical protein AAFQ75_15325, partial [Pseudomonadota bacterium]